MRSLTPVLLAATVLASTGFFPPTDAVHGVFEGKTPCGAIANEFTGFPAANCEKIKWRLTLRRDAQTGAPTTYRYEGTRTAHDGRWSITEARGRVIFRLEHGAARSLSLLNIDDRVLVLLDRDLKALPGDAAYSYVLNRVGNAAP